MTVVIKTFNRPNCLRRLVKSIKKYYPDMHIIVADDSKKPRPRDDVEYHVLPFDVGLSAGRNYLVKQVKTPYTLLLDDDYHFTKETRVEKLFKALEDTDIDIIGGRLKERGKIQSYHGTLIRKGGRLYHMRKSRGREGRYRLYDIISNFFLARTETLRRSPWDKRLKVGEHTDFFWTYKGKFIVALHRRVFIDHRPNSGSSYRRYRSRAKRYHKLSLEKHRISSRVRTFGKRSVGRKRTAARKRTTVRKRAGA